MHNRYKRALLLVVAVALAVSVGVVTDNLFVKRQAQAMLDRQSPVDTLATLKLKVYRGNVEAYDELKHFYLDYPKEEMLFWSFLMANKYHDASACLDVATMLESICDEDPYAFSIKKADAPTKAVILSYLRLSASGGNEEARSILAALPATAN